MQKHEKICKKHLHFPQEERIVGKNGRTVGGQPPDESEERINYGKYTAK